MAQRKNPELCYQCDQALAEPISDDHVPPLAFFPPANRTRHNPSQLITIPVHLACNKAYELDEVFQVFPLSRQHRSYLHSRRLKPEGIIQLLQCDEIVRVFDADRLLDRRPSTPMRKG